jgi:hypothetical protein
VSEDWKVGDLAVCVDDRVNPAAGIICVQAGQIYRVEAVGPLAANRLLGVGLGLFMEGVDNGPLGHSEHRFRKIRPDEHEDCEPEFVELLKLSKQRVST